MRTLKNVRNALLLAGLILMAACGSSPLEVAGLQVEMQENPIALGVEQPRFSWRIEAAVPDVQQIGYRIEVAATESNLKSGKDLLWNSGYVESGLSILIPYEGPAPESRKIYWWRVKVNTDKGEIAWSEPACWTMSLLNASDWQAEWIGIDGATNPGENLGGTATPDGNATRLAARYLRKEFEASGKPVRATLYMCGLGASEAYLNGKRVSDDVLAPIQSHFPGTTYFNTYDATPFVASGRNAVGIILGNGRYLSMRNPGAVTYGLPSLLAQLEIEYADGTTQTVISNASWQATAGGPIVANNEYDGEEYDARREMPGWNEAGFDASAWQAPDIMKAPGQNLQPQSTPSMKVMEEIKPVSITAMPDGRYILDMGQNMVGWLRVSLQGKAGQQVTMRFSELLKDGELYMDNLRGAKCTDIYTPAADGAFEWEPRFVFHGFRYAEISGLDYNPETESFTGRVIYDEMKTTGKFTTSNDVINQVFKNAYWGIRGNYRGFPTDCPQRDERHGWLGDRTTGAYGEAFVFGNALLYSKWMQDIEDSQSPEGSISVVSPRYWTAYNDDVTWPAAYFNVADMLFRHYGDDRAIVRHYPSMKKWVDHMVAERLLDYGPMKDYILDRHGSKGEIVDPLLSHPWIIGKLDSMIRAGKKGYILAHDTYGDWCVPPESQDLIHSKDPKRKTPGPILSTTVFYHILNRMAGYAVISGNAGDEARYLDLAKKVKASYNDLFFDPAAGRYGNNTVTGNILSLMLGLVPEGCEESVMANIYDKTANELGGHVSAGVLGVQHLMRGLTAYGHQDLAYKIATNTTYPSWGYMVEQGATTIWELWNGNTANPAMNSCNHVMLLGDLLIWYYENLAGIKNDPSGAAFKKLLMSPTFPEGLEEVNAAYDSPYGEMVSHWTLRGGVFDWQIELPANTSARVEIPAEFGVKADEKGGIRSVETGSETTVIEIGSGKYRFTTAR